MQGLVGSGVRLRTSVIRCRLMSDGYAVAPVTFLGPAIIERSISNMADDCERSN
jgi:hypothetical protein